MELQDDSFMDQENQKEHVSDEKVQMAWQLFASLEYQVQVADRKVQAVFGMNAFLVAAISLQNQQSFHILLQGGLNVNVVMDLFLKGCFIACVSIATWAAIRALRPRVKFKQADKSFPQNSLFYFGDIQGMSVKNFTDTFISLHNDEIVKQLLSQAQTIYKILTRKYALLHRSTLFLSIALIIWALLSVNKFLS